ncbi:hypothetical protein M3A49_21710 [Paraburkholderia sp. CNPSo 3076]|uniref:hypothetical protein n=1 Tax=Paraburkholderia sp. CNPSo 3076 TaxID=2940936 RepID=UPI0022519532|nr:hypothetical protein [Paraburkholderia sp. CNPSo 3076]MCX5542094.1 hypothetical protein [Paraburkholderia sp. CNPSo 3076]
MNKKNTSAVAVSMASAASLLCAGCGTGINVTHVTTDPAALTGVPWTLSMTQFTVVVSREVTGCTGTLEGKVTVQITPGRAPDPDQRYLLDSTGWFSTSDITSNLASDGSNTGLNASSEDETGKILASVATTVAQIVIGAAVKAPTGGGAQIQGGGGAEKTAQLGCSDAVLKAFAKLRPPHQISLQKRVTEETKTLSQATDKVTLLTAQADKDASYKKPLAKALGMQDAAQQKLTADQNELAANRKVVTETQTLVWPSDGTQYKADNVNHLLPDTLTHWISDFNAENPPDTHRFDVSLAIYVPMPGGNWAVAKEQSRADTSIGIPVRTTAPGRLLVCAGQTPCPSDLPNTWVADKHQAVKDQPMLQLGQMYNVRAAGGTFKSEGAVIALDSNGAPSSIQVTEKAAAAAVAASSAAAAATTAAGIPNAIAAARLTQAQAESAQIAADTAKITYQANLPTAAQTARDQAQTAADNAKIALASAQANARNAGPAAALAAQASLLNSQNALRALEAGEPNVEQEDALSAQTTLDLAQAAQINAQVSLTKARSLLP